MFSTAACFPLVWLALLVVLVVGGCGASRPGPGPGTPGPRTATGPETPVAEAQRRHEYPSPRPPVERAAGSPSATAAIRAFATAYINWTYTTIASDLRGLAAASVGQARAAMTLAAAQTASDYELRRGQVSNQGTVEAVAPRPGQPDQFVVVTQELTMAAATNAYQGLQPAWHVALATVVRQPDGAYAISSWQPES